MTTDQEWQIPEGLDDGLDSLDLVTIGRPRPGDTEEAKRRRGRAFFKNRGSQVTPLILSERNGVLRWNADPKIYGGRRGSRAGVGAGRIVKQYAFDHEGENKIATLVRNRENATLKAGKKGLYRLRPNQNDLYEYSEAVPINDPDYFDGKKILLFIHGTFSHCDTTLDQINEAGTSSNRFGQAFLAKAYKDKYDMVLSYNHATLSVSPLLNAFELAALLRTPAAKRPQQIDIICHSRGGVVSRWFVEGFGDPGVKYKVVFVAAPLGGTTLASPTHLKAGAELLANYSRVVAKAGKMAPANGLFVLSTIIAKISQFAFTGLAKTPVFDVATAVIPGLMGQARISNNFELEALHKAGAWASHHNNYFCLASNFKPHKSDIWKFWHAFNDTKKYAMNFGDRAADSLIFVNREDKDNPKPLPNDVVVDTASMSELRSGSEFIQNVHKFKASAQIHHTNYFSHETSFEKFQEWLF